MMKRIAILSVLGCLLTAVAWGMNVDSLKVAADSAYAREDFAAAAKCYGRIAQAGESAAVCYNLGNCYYRMDDVARAILWYERALLLSPGDEDIRFNLNMARGKTIDRVTPEHEFFFVTGWRAMVNTMSADDWARLSIVLFVIALAGLAVYLYVGRMAVRKVGFTVSVVFVLLTVLGNLCAWSQHRSQTERREAIVMASSATVRSTPSASGSDLFVLHEGTKATVKDNTLGDWVEIALSDGKQGWIERQQIEFI